MAGLKAAALGVLVGLHGPGPRPAEPPDTPPLVPVTAQPWPWGQCGCRALRLWTRVVACGGNVGGPPLGGGGSSERQGTPAGGRAGKLRSVRHGLPWQSTRGASISSLSWSCLSRPRQGHRARPRVRFKEGHQRPPLARCHGVFSSFVYSFTRSFHHSFPTPESVS